jgi:hypothetical protein
LPQTGVFNPFASVENQEQFDGSRAVYRRDWAYLVTITGSDGAGTSTQTVSGTTLTASFTVDYTPNWSVTVQAHNAFGWGPSSSVFTLGGL